HHPLYYAVGASGRASERGIASSTGLIYVEREGVEDRSLWLIMLSPSRSLNLSAPTDYLGGCAIFDMAQGKMTPRPSPLRWHHNTWRARSKRRFRSRI